MILLGSNRICRGRSPLAFLTKLLILFLVYLLLVSLERRVIYTIMQAKQTINNKHKISKNREGYGVKYVVHVVRIA